LSFNNSNFNQESSSHRDFDVDVEVETVKESFEIPMIKPSALLKSSIMNQGPIRQAVTSQGKINLSAESINLSDNENDKKYNHP
jgi:hypothetical protein